MTSSSCFVYFDELGSTQHLCWAQKSRLASVDIVGILWWLVIVSPLFIIITGHVLVMVGFIVLQWLLLILCWLGRGAFTVGGRYGKVITLAAVVVKVVLINLGWLNVSCVNRL